VNRPTAFTADSRHHASHSSKQYVLQVDPVTLDSFSPIVEVTHEYLKFLVAFDEACTGFSDVAKDKNQSIFFNRFLEFKTESDRFFSQIIRTYRHQKATDHVIHSYLDTYIRPFFSRSLLASQIIEAYSTDLPYTVVESLHKVSSYDAGKTGDYVQQYLLDSNFGKALLNRKAYFGEKISRIASDEGSGKKLVSLTSGSSLELCEFIQNDPRAEQFQYHCLDAKQEALTSAVRILSKRKSNFPLLYFDYVFDIFDPERAAVDSILMRGASLYYLPSPIQWKSSLLYSKLSQVFNFINPLMTSESNFSIPFFRKELLNPVLMSILNIDVRDFPSEQEVLAVSRKFCPSSVIVESDCGNFFLENSH